MPMDFLNQNILLVGIALFSAGSLIWPLIVRPAGQSVTPAQATLLVNRQNALVVDVREVGEYANGHVPDAVNYPLAKLSESLDALADWKDKPVVLCCATGMRSGKACAELKKQGFTQLHNLEGGVDAWVSGGYPLQKKEGSSKGGKKK